MDMLNHLLASQVDHSLVRKLKVYTEPPLLVCDELGYLCLDPQTQYRHYHEHAVLRLGQHPLQHDHRYGHRRSFGRKLRNLFARR